MRCCNLLLGDGEGEMNVCAHVFVAELHMGDGRYSTLYTLGVDYSALGDWASLLFLGSCMYASLLRSGKLIKYVLLLHYSALPSVKISCLNIFALRDFFSSCVS